MPKHRLILLAAALGAGLGAGLGLAAPAGAQDRPVILQSTTSTQNAGLYEAILPEFEQETGIEVRVVAVGTGQALKNARNCDGDVVLVHAPEAERRFVAEGYGIERAELMHNDFVIVGPYADPAGIAGMSDVEAALGKIAAAHAPFASRGDDSGTHKRELALWQAAGVDPAEASGTWYRETGSGMGATLNTATGMGAYALTDRASWLAFANKADHEIMVEGDAALSNQYSVILVNPARCPNVQAEAARTFIDWLLSEEGRAAIAAVRAEGRQLFTPGTPE